ncbi:MAG: XdhC family protein [Anaerolineae bacterium]
MGGVGEERDGALATVAEVKGASPAKVGAKIVVWPDGRRVGTVGGGKLEERVVAEAQEALRKGESRLVHYTLREEGEDAVGMLCGGEVQIFVELCNPRPTLLIIGGGHIGRPLAEMGRLLDFDVRVVDVVEEGALPAALDEQPIDSSTYIAIITGDHVADELALHHVIDSPAVYIGMIGSRRKVRILLDNLRKDGVAEAQLQRVYAPIGLDLGGTTPAEIALSVMAQIVKLRSGGTAESKALQKARIAP